MSEIQLQHIVEQIKAHPKFESLHWIQQQRIIVAAGWTKFVITGLKTSGHKRADVLAIVERHGTHKEFNGILFDIISKA